MDLHLLIDLLKKYRLGKCSEEETEQINHWYHDFDLLAEEIPPIPEEKLLLLRENIEYRLGRRKKQVHYRKFLRYVSGLAAVLVITLSVVWYLMSYSPDNEQSPGLIRPGQHYARLQLSDGTLVELDSTAVVKTDCGVVIKKDASAILDYSLAKAIPEEDRFNTIQVPAGGEYCVRLSDGTQVWMNSGSELKFPIAFNNELRKVELSGEAYFKVAKSQTPFVVKTSRMDIRVLGTAFNVSDYQEDRYVTTALAEGRIRVAIPHREQEYEMSPGYVLSCEKGTGHIELKECDPDLYTSWVDGKFKFRDMRLDDIMIKLARWYNCEFFYQNPGLKELRFSGAAEKDRPVNYLLEMIETVTDVHFEIKGQTVILRQK